MTEPKIRFFGKHNIDQMLQDLNGLDVAEERPVAVAHGFDLAGQGDNWQQQNNVKAIWNTTKNHFVTVVSSKYTLIQHAEAFKPALETVRALGLKVKGEMFSQGPRAWAYCLFQDHEIKPADGEKIQLGVMFKNGFTGTNAISGVAFAGRLVCQNGMILGKVLGQRCYMRHIGEIKMPFEDLIKQVIDSSARLTEIANEAIAESITYAEVEALLKALMPPKMAQELMLELKDYERISRWDVYNSMTAYMSHNMNSQRTRDKLSPLAQQILEQKFPQLLNLAEQHTRVRA